MTAYDLNIDKGFDILIDKADDALKDENVEDNYSMYLKFTNLKKTTRYVNQRLYTRV